MSPITILFILIIALCIAVTVIINILTAKHSSLKDLQKELDAKRKKHLDLKHKPESAEEELQTLASEAEKAEQAYDAALSVYNDYIKRFPGVLAAQVLGFKSVSKGK